mmetsp:Transcript_21367/g.33055  ORF Transcript_21367/g.33055 Transcript_21367/m.33055 type:complete len:111 (+) Transcript_21367:5294-5626(+)
MIVTVPSFKQAKQTYNTTMILTSASESGPQVRSDFFSPLPYTESEQFFNCELRDLASKAEVSKLCKYTLLPDNKVKEVRVLDLCSGNRQNSDPCLLGDVGFEVLFPIVNS